MHWITDYFDSLVNAIASVFNWIFEQLMIALISVLTLIPVPSWLSNASPAIQQMFDTFGWGLGIMQADFGLAVTISALLIRFTIRRLPVVG